MQDQHIVVVEIQIKAIYSSFVMNIHTIYIFKIIIICELDISKHMQPCIHINLERLISIVKFTQLVLYIHFPCINKEPTVYFMSKKKQKYSQYITSMKDQSFLLLVPSSKCLTQVHGKVLRVKGHHDICYCLSNGTAVFVRLVPHEVRVRVWESL